jgi:hypothetical protein
MGYKKIKNTKEALEKNPKFENHKFCKHHKETNNVVQVEKR